MHETVEHCKHAGDHLKLSKSEATNVHLESSEARIQWNDFVRIGIYLVDSTSGRAGAGKADIPKQNF